MNGHRVISPADRCRRAPCLDQARASVHCSSCKHRDASDRPCGAASLRSAPSERQATVWVDGGLPRGRFAAGIAGGGGVFDLPPESTPDEETHSSTASRMACARSGRVYLRVGAQVAPIRASSGQWEFVIRWPFCSLDREGLDREVPGAWCLGALCPSGREMARRGHGARCPFLASVRVVLGEQERTLCLSSACLSTMSTQG